MPRTLNTDSSKTLARLRVTSWTYTAGYFAYVVVAGIKMWPTTIWPQWWADLAVEAGGMARFGPSISHAYSAFGSSHSSGKSEFSTA
jgi:hypothetical protein